MSGRDACKNYDSKQYERKKGTRLSKEVRNRCASASAHLARFGESMYGVEAGVTVSLGRRRS